MQPRVNLSKCTGGEMPFRGGRHKVLDPMTGRVMGSFPYFGVPGTTRVKMTGRSRIEKYKTGNPVIVQHVQVFEGTIAPRGKYDGAALRKIRKTHR